MLYEVITLIALFDPAEQRNLLSPDLVAAAPEDDGAAAALEARNNFV